MSRIVRNSKVDTRSARSRLKQRAEPYWVPLARGRALGYRRGKTGGTWIARYYDPAGTPRLRYEALGGADDAIDADEIEILSYGEAQERARRWFSEVLRSVGLDTPSTAGPYTVEAAARDYMIWFAAHRESTAATQTTINALILPKLGKRSIAHLSPPIIRRWHIELANTPARLRSRAGAAQNVRETSADPDAVRRRRSTANRVLTVLKAILNHAWKEGRAASDDAWRRVRPFREADAARVRDPARTSADALSTLVNPTSGF